MTRARDVLVSRPRADRTLSGRRVGRAVGCCSRRVFGGGAAATLVGRTRRGLGVVVVALGLAPAMAHAQTKVVEYYGLDAIGSIRVVFDASGAVVARTDYLPFGENLQLTGTLPPWQFTGQIRDSEAGQDDFGARRYQPRHGRFTAVDPVYAGLFDPQQWNRYAYARSSPLVFVDPDGRQFRSGVECRYPGGGPGCPFVGEVLGPGLPYHESPGRFHPQPNRDHRPAGCCCSGGSGPGAGEPGLLRWRRRWRGRRAPHGSTRRASST